MKCMLNDLIKRIQRILKRKDQNTYIHVNLWCPDGNRESLGFSVSEEINEFISFINTFSKLKEYTIELRKMVVDEPTLYLVNHSRNPEETLLRLVR